MQQVIMSLAAGMGIEMTVKQAEQFLHYAKRLLEVNRSFNLTGITGLREVFIKHFLDSLALLLAMPYPQGPLIDVGSGAGFPGIPLKIMFPGLAVTLLDSLRKRTDFLEETVRSLGLREVTIVHGRAEDLGRDPCYREKYPLVVARAVAPLPVLAELCLPFAAVGGIFAAYKGPEGDRELAAAGGALELLGGGRTGKFFYNLPEGQGRRILLLIKKEKNTAEKYPRRAGKPQRSPLG